MIPFVIPLARSVRQSGGVFFCFVIYTLHRLMICTYASGELRSAGGPWYGMFFFKLRLIPDVGVVIVTGDGELNRKMGWYSSHGFPT